MNKEEVAYRLLDKQIDYEGKGRFIDTDNMVLRYKEIVNKLDTDNDLENQRSLINCIENKINNHFNKLDRGVFEDTNLLKEIQELISTYKGSDKK